VPKTEIDPVPVSLLRHRPFVLYWVARVFAAFAFQMVGVAVGWQIYALTGNAFDLGLVGLVQFLPATVLVLVAGQLADRYDRRAILQACQAVEGLAAAALAVGTLGGFISKDFILTALFFFGAARAFESTTNQTLLPAVVPTALFPRAVAAASSAQQAATITGPAIGGLLYALSPGAVYVLAGAMFVSASVALAFVPVIPAARSLATRPPLTFEVFFAGVGFIRRNRIVLGVISLDLFAVLLGGAMVLLPVFAKDVFDVGPSGLGLLRAAPAVGALGIMVLLSRAAFTRRVGRIMFTAVACFGLATVVFAVSTSFWLSMAALVILGASDAVSVVIRQTLVQLETPDEMRGRVSAVNSLFVGMSNQLGDFRAGMAAALIGAIPAVLVGGIGTLLTVLFCIKFFPELYEIEGFHSVRKGKSE
jgi:MFS family permease